VFERLVNLLVAPHPDADDTISNPLTPPKVEQYLEIRGAALWVEVSGRGVPLVLLHGGAHDSGIWHPYLSELGQQRTVITVDARAHGRSHDSEAPFSYDDFAQDVKCVLDEIRVDRADFVGWSDGGVVALLLASRFPALVENLVAISANFRVAGMQPGFLRWLRSATPDSFDVRLRERYERIAPDPSGFATLAGKLLALWRVQPEIARDELTRIRARTLVCAASRDLVREEHTAELAHLINGATRASIPESTHEVVRDHPDRVLPLLSEFLARYG